MFPLFSATKHTGSRHHLAPLGAAARKGIAARGPAATALAMLAMLAGAGCASAPAGPSQLAPGARLKIGYLASLTGFCAGFARQYAKGAELAVRKINARGGVLGHRLTLVVRDDRATPVTGVSQARQLVAAGVRYLAGTCSGAVGKSVGQLVANPDHVLYVAGLADPSAFAGGPGVYVFDTIPTSTIEARNAAAYIRAHPRWRRIAVIAEGYDYGRQVAAAFARSLAGSPANIVSTTYLPSTAASYAPAIERLLAQRPDAVYSSAIDQDAVTLVRQGLPLGLFAKTAFIGVMDYPTLARMPSPPLGSEGYTNYPAAPIYRTRFARQLRSLGQAAANGGAAGDGFNQIQVIAQGIAKARSTDPTAVRDALAGATVQTVQGPVRIHACDHQLAVPIAMGTVTGPTRAQPFPHLRPPTPIDTGRYFDC